MRITKQTYLLAFFFFLYSIFSALLNAQNLELNFFHLTREDGLSDNSINSIAIDNDGFIWLGTNVGLNRYDGTKFHTFYEGDDKNSLPNNEVDNLFINSYGELWLSTSGNGVSYYNSSIESFRNYNFVDETHSEGSNIIVNIVEDSDSILYVATKEGVFYKSKENTNFQELLIANHPEANKSVGAITMDENKGVWIVFENWDVVFYHHKKNIIKYFAIERKNKEIDLSNVSSAIHNKGKLWIGTYNYSFICYDPEQNSYTEPLAESKIITYTQLLQGTQKNILWMATSDGLMRYNQATGNLERYTSILTDNSSLSATSISCIYETPDNMLWVGTYDAGINYAYLDRPFKHINVIEGGNYALSEENIKSILHDSYGDIWFGYVGGTIEWYSNKTKNKIKIPIKSLINHWGSGTVFKLYEDSKGNIYACSWSGGVQKFNRETLEFNPLTGSSNSFLTLFEATDFRDIEEDSYGNFWLAAHGKGVIMYNPKNNSIKKIDESLGLSNNWVYDIDIDKNNNIWIDTAWGLSKITAGTNVVKTYFSLEDDSSSLTDNRSEYVKVTEDKNIWIGTNKGLSLYNESSDNFYRFWKRERSPRDFY